VANLDEISLMLGEIRSDIKHALMWQREHEDKDQERYDKLAERIDAGNHVRTRVQQVERDLAASLPILEGIRKMRWVAAGFIGAVALAGGVAGGFATTLFKLLA
jgi:hypothetical protein